MLIQVDGDITMSGLADEAIKALRKKWTLNEWDRKDLYFGGVHAVAPAGDCGGDLRRGGHGEIVFSS